MNDPGMKFVVTGYVIGIVLLWGYALWQWWVLRKLAEKEER